MLTKVKVVACTFSGKRNSIVHILEHMTGMQNALLGPSLAFFYKENNNEHIWNPAKSSRVISRGTRLGWIIRVYLVVIIHLIKLFETIS